MTLRQVRRVDSNVNRGLEDVVAPGVPGKSPTKKARYILVGGFQTFGNFPFHIIWDIFSID